MTRGSKQRASDSVRSAARDLRHEHTPALEIDGNNPTLEIDGNNKAAGLALELTESGHAKGSQRNAITYLSQHPRWRGVIGLDLRDETAVFLKKPPAYVRADETYPHAIADVHLTAIIAWLSRQSGAEFAEGKVARAVDLVAHQQSFDPVAAYLESLRWDGRSRIDDWLVTHMDSPDVGFARVVGSKFLIAAVARALQPGCQVDTVLILEGAQGSGKTSALRLLAGQYHRGDLPPLGTRDAKEALRGGWLIELGELDCVHKSEMSAIKNYITQASDHYRAPYDRKSKTHPRRVIFVGTTNDTEYLRDHTGNRRFWPVECGRIDLARLSRDRDQLWAEAVARYRRGEPWHLTQRSEFELATLAQEQRAEVDPWEERIGDLVALKNEIRLSDLMQRLETPLSMQSQREKNRIARILQRFGYRRTQARDGAKRCWLYRREEPQSSYASAVGSSPVSPPSRPEAAMGDAAHRSGQWTGDTGDDQPPNGGKPE